jgi:hypothetical protein
MPTPTGTISLNDVNIELGRSSGANINMNDSAVRTLAGVGGSGTIITMDNLRGKSNASVAISNQSALDFSYAGSGGTGYARYQLNANGVAYRTNVSGTLISISGEWLTSGAASLFEAYATWSGSYGNPGGITGSWLNLGTTREWLLYQEDGYASRTLAVQIRLASSGAVLDTATITFEVDSSP